VLLAVDDVVISRSVQLLFADDVYLETLVQLCLSSIAARETDGVCDNGCCAFVRL